VTCAGIYHFESSTLRETSRQRQSGLATHAPYVGIFPTGFPNVDHWEDFPDNNCEKSPILLAAPAELSGCRIVNGLHLQTSLRRLIERKGLFGGLTNRIRTSHLDH